MRLNILNTNLAPQWGYRRWACQGIAAWGGGQQLPQWCHLKCYCRNDWVASLSLSLLSKQYGKLMLSCSPFSWPFYHDNNTVQTWSSLWCNVYHGVWLLLFNLNTMLIMNINVFIMLLTCIFSLMLPNESTGKQQIIWMLIFTMHVVCAWCLIILLYYACSYRFVWNLQDFKSRSY